MEAQKSKGESAFNKLHGIRVPHILESIFFSLDYASFRKCKEVSRAWQELITSKSFKKIGKLTFRKEIEKNLWLALDVGLACPSSVLASGIRTRTLIGKPCAKQHLLYVRSAPSLRKSGWYGGGIFGPLVRVL